MQYEEVRRALNVRGLLESTETPFAVADYEPRAVIFLQGDPCDSVMHIEKGGVRLAVTARSGKEAICGVLGAGAFLGEEVLVVAKAHVLGLLRTQSAIADRFIAHILARNAHLEADLTDQLLHSSEQRLARTLLVLAGCDERRRCRGILIEEVGDRLEVNSSLLRVIHDADRGVPNGTSRTSSGVGDWKDDVLGSTANEQKADAR